MIHSDHFCVVAILRLRAVRRLQKLNASLGHANREAERPVGARAVHPRGGPIFVHGFLEDYAVYAVLAKKKSLAIGMLIFLWMKHPHSACYFFVELARKHADLRREKKPREAARADAR
jgi:hypothetical protein